MPLCLWKGCEFEFEEFAAFQEHVNTTHVQPQRPSQQQQQQNLDKQNDVGPKEEMVDQGQMAKLNLDENKMIKTSGKRQKKA
jgi:hypothetical protein